MPQCASVLMLLNNLTVLITLTSTYVMIPSIIFVCAVLLFFFFYNHLDTYQYSNFVLNYRSHYQIHISILMKYVLLMFLSHLFIFSYWTFSNLYVLFKRDIHSTKATFKSITTSITYECRVIKFIKIQINKNWSGCCSWSINQG